MSVCDLTETSGPCARFVVWREAIWGFAFCHIVRHARSVPLPRHCRRKMAAMAAAAFEHHMQQALWVLSTAAGGTH